MKWEYKRIEKELTEVELNKLGEKGWELVVGVPLECQLGLYFKRPKE